MEFERFASHVQPEIADSVSASHFDRPCPAQPRPEKIDNILVLVTIKYRDWLRFLCRKQLYMQCSFHQKRALLDLISGPQSTAKPYPEVRSRGMIQNALQLPFR
jgi:hypothetical protein